MADTQNECLQPPSRTGSPPSAGLDEQDLVRRLQLGQEWACNTLVCQYQDRLLKIAYGITLDHEESREIVQDVFVSAITRISRLRESASLGSWLRKITVNACLNWKRKWKRRFKWGHTPLEPDTEFMVYHKACQGETPESRLREKEQEKALATAVGRLPEKIRVVFVLNTLEGLSYKQISHTLGIKEGTVSSRLYRARKMILDDLATNTDYSKGSPA